MVMKTYSWLITQKSLLVMLGESNEVPEMNLNRPHARQGTRQVHFKLCTIFLEARPIGLN